MEVVRSNLGHNTFFSTCILTGLVDPNRKFKARVVNGNKIYGGKGKAVSIRDIFCNMTHPWIRPGPPHSIQ